MKVIFKHSETASNWAKTKPAVQQPKWSPKVMIWGGISWEEVTALKMGNSRVNLDSYQDILEECLVPSADVYNVEQNVWDSQLSS